MSPKTQPDTAAVPPQNLDAEESILGAMLLSPRAIDAVAPIVDPADFYRPSHGRIYRAALTMHQQGDPVDAITVAHRLQELGQLDPDGAHEGALTVGRVHELAALVTATANVGHYARIVAKLARARVVAERAAGIHRRALDLDDPDELEQELRDLADNIAGRRDRGPAPTIATLDQFIHTDEEHAEAIIGERGETLLPAGGLLIIGGEGGASKTTLTLDAIAHLASGTSWLGYPTARPIRALIIENEGPRPQFRDKLRDKATSWTGAAWRHNVHVWEEPWAIFSFAREADRRHLRDITIEHQIDVVVADPLDSLGVVGAGTPEETRTFINWLRECGLHNPDQPLAFWLLHHFNKTGRGSVIAQLSGAWGGHPDAILGVELGDGQTTKLTWGKLRHATPPASRVTMLAWNTDTRGFTPIDQGRPSTDSETVEQAILAYINANPGRARSNAEEAIHESLDGVSRKQIRTTIDRLLTGDEPALKSLAGAVRNGKYLHLAQPLATSTASTSPETAQTHGSPLATPLFGERGEQNYPEDRNARRAPADDEHPQNGSATGKGTRSPPAVPPEGGAGGEGNLTLSDEDAEERWHALLQAGEPEPLEHQ